MNTTLVKCIGVVLTLFSATFCIQAQDAGASKSSEPLEYGRADFSGHTEVIPIESEPGLKAFVEAFLAANNAKDLEKIRRMYHPKDLEAVMAFEANKPASYPTMLLQTAMPQNHSPFKVSRYLKDSPLPSDGWADWPVRPTHLVQCYFEPAPNSVVIFAVHLVRVDGHWFAVHGVPSANAIKLMTQPKK